MEQLKQINFIDIWKATWKHKKDFIVFVPISFLVSCFFVLSIPRWYSCNVELAPESQISNMNQLSSLASSFGIDLNSSPNKSIDAITPELYPDIIGSKDFQTKLFPIKIQTLDGKVSTDYYNYLLHYQKVAWWEALIGKIELFFKGNEQLLDSRQRKYKIPFMLTKQQMEITQKIGGNISCSVDKKTGTINVTVKDQDPLVCTTMADSVTQLLQNFITEYRTKKAKNDLMYTQKLFYEAKADYIKARQAYGAYGDSNNDIVLQSVQLKAEDMENDMQLKYNAYSSLSTRLQAAKAKLQEVTPAFTTLQNATVPIKPVGPKRMIIVTVIVFLTIIACSVYAIIKENII